MVSLCSSACCQCFVVLLEAGRRTSSLFLAWAFVHSGFSFFTLFFLGCRVSSLLFPAAFVVLLRRGTLCGTTTVARASLTCLLAPRSSKLTLARSLLSQTTARCVFRSATNREIAQQGIRDDAVGESSVVYSLANWCLAFYVASFVATALVVLRSGSVFLLLCFYSLVSTCFAVFLVIPHILAFFSRLPSLLCLLSCPQSLDCAARALPSPILVSHLFLSYASPPLPPFSPHLLFTVCRKCGFQPMRQMPS